MSLTEDQQLILLRLAQQSIEQGLQTGRRLTVKPEEFPEELLQRRASFVTLQINRELRGCIGSLTAVKPLINDVCDNAFAAAFRDPRFPVLQESEFDHLEIHISILTPQEPISFTSEQDLLAQIQPGIDGLVLTEGSRRGTFLPSVWTSLKSPEQFLRHLKQKAGLPQDYWSNRIQVSRYRTEEFGRKLSEFRAQPHNPKDR